jgi:hypothetical protein
MVGGAGCEFSDIRGEEDTCDVGVVGGEFANGNEGGNVAFLKHAPDEDGALILMVNLVRTMFGRFARRTMIEIEM